MDLYTLTDTFLAKDVVDEYVSAIWTERYFSAGDVQLVVPANDDTLEKLKDGTYLALRGSKEVMELQTQSIESGLMTVVGAALPTFLDQRISWFKNPNYGTGEGQTEDRIVDYSATTSIGQFLADIVDKMVINPVPITGGSTWADVQLQWDDEKIDAIELGTIDTTSTAERYTMPTGPIYRGLQSLAEQEGIGFTLYLDSADPVEGYVLKFTVYKGKDHTMDGAYPLVRLTPDMDSLSGLKEVRSNANYKNVCYVYYKNKVAVFYAEPSLPIPEGFARRVMVTDAEGEPVGRKVTYNYGLQGYGGAWTNYVVGTAEINAFLEQNAKDALANNNYIQAIDGQTSPNNDYKYGVDYGLGDIIELEGLTGAISKARVTEYIRSEDKIGEREYPTISVLAG